MENLSLKSRETFRKHYMNPALDLGLVHRTLPDKPQSRNQRYIKN
ncbi:Fic family protein [Eubacterium aggregans]